MKLDEAIETLKVDEECLRADVRRLEGKIAEPGRRPCELRKFGRDCTIAIGSAEAINVVLATIEELRRKHTTAPIEREHDPVLAHIFGIPIDAVRSERMKALTIVQSRMREKGHTVPDDLTAFAEWCKSKLAGSS